jgi:hypothetical protein
MKFSKIYSNNLKNKIAKKNIPKRLILCHGRNSKKYNFIDNRKNLLYLDNNEKSNPDIIMNLYHVHKIKPYHLKHKFMHITSVHAPIYLFFNKYADYLLFSSPKNKIWGHYYKSQQFKNNFKFLNRKKDLSVQKILNSNYIFNKNFLHSLLFLLDIGGEFEFTDNFLFQEKNISDKNAIKIIKKFLGNQNSYFDVYIALKSNCINYNKKIIFDNFCTNKFIIIKKIKNLF